MSIVNTVSGITPSTSIIPPTQSFTNAALSRILAEEASSTSASSSTSATDSTASSSSGQTSGVSSFAAILGNLLPANQQEEVNEEQLFAALLEERLTTLKDVDTATAYHQLFESYQGTMVYGNGTPMVEEAARAALSDLVTDGTLTTEEAEKIHAQAFRAAQIDGNSGALYDGLGTTMAVTLGNLALASSEEMMAGFDSGEMDAGRLALNYNQENGPAQFVGGDAVATSSSGATAGFSGGDGFLFKPVSEGNGNLVILLPAAMDQSVASVTLADGSGQILESGDASGAFDDGRPIFRFDQPGASYPSNLTVTVAMLDGSERVYNIADPSQRYE